MLGELRAASSFLTYGLGEETGPDILVGRGCPKFGAGVAEDCDARNEFG